MRPLDAEACRWWCVMSHQSELIATDIEAYLAEHERKDLLGSSPADPSTTANRP